MRSTVEGLLQSTSVRLSGRVSIASLSAARRDSNEASPSLASTEQSSSVARTLGRVVCRSRAASSLASSISRPIASSTVGESEAVTREVAQPAGSEARNVFSRLRSSSSAKTESASSTTRVSRLSVANEGVGPRRCACSRPSVATQSSTPPPSLERCVAIGNSEVHTATRSGIGPATCLASRTTCCARSVVGTRMIARTAPGGVLPLSASASAMRWSRGTR
mmetsp:Transcript_31647/g.74762  ORF Transcript_31647/g.74762 Transcript_31647/m.74762 type:complete len:221 (-) Transcript_31647:473-1135(-)